MIKRVLHKSYRPISKLIVRDRFRLALSVIAASALVACAANSDQMRLSDLGSRYWKGTYYLSVAGTPTSVKCSIDKNYKEAGDVKVYYQGNLADPLFPLDDDQAKLRDLKQQCFDRSFE